MSQDWIVLDLYERAWLESADKAGDCADLVLGALRVPRTIDKIHSMLAGRFHRQRAAPLMRLPPELLHDILELLNPTGPYIPALFLFALTCKRALAAAAPHIAHLQRRHFAPLAGHRLLCIADGAHPRSAYPRRFFTTNDGEDVFPDAGDDEHAALAKLVRRSWRRFVSDPPSLVRPADFIWRRSTVSRMGMPDFLRFRELSEPSYQPAGDDPWVLCNLTKREYVRANALDDISSPCNAGRLLEAVLRMWISCDPDVSVVGASEKGTETVGKWASDCFEVTTLGELVNSGQGLSDVTQEAMSFVQCGGRGLGGIQLDCPAPSAIL